MINFEQHRARTAKPKLHLVSYTMDIIAQLFIKVPREVFDRDFNGGGGGLLTQHL